MGIAAAGAAFRPRAGIGSIIEAETFSSDIYRVRFVMYRVRNRALTRRSKPARSLLQRLHKAKLERVSGHEPARHKRGIMEHAPHGGCSTIRHKSLQFGF